MIEDRMKLLVAALRSGKYKQGRSVLRVTDSVYDTDAYCCLGVACDISGLGKWGRFDEEWFYVPVDGHSHDKVLPVLVQKYFGFRETSPIVATNPDESDESCSLTTMNDEGKTFEEIADFIEANWQNL